MDGARLWQGTLVGILVAHAVGLVVLLVGRGFTPFAIYDADFLHLALAGAAGLAWSLEHVRRRPALAGLALAAFAATALFAVWAADTAAAPPVESPPSPPRPSAQAALALVLAGYTVPPVLLLAHGQRRPAALAGAGALLLLAGVALAAWRYHTENRYGDRDLTVQIAGGALALAGLVDALRQPRRWPARTRDVPVSGLLGVALLALSWGFGGQALIVLPLYALAPLALAAPALLAARHRPLRALAAVALLGAGAVVPAAECTYPFVTDAPEPDDPAIARVETKSVWTLAGRGPWWQQDDLFASYSVRCEPRLPLLALAWLAALVAVAWPRWPEPRWPKPF